MKLWMQQERRKGEVAKPILTEQRVVLSNVNWQQYEKLLLELGAERQARLTYFRGKLELMTPVEEHERCHKLIESLVLVLVDELFLNVTTIAPAALRNSELGCATEPDACYYFQESGRSVKNKTEIDLLQDPVPALLVEVALTKSAVDKLPIYASLGVPEVWQYITTAGAEVLQGKLVIYQLQADRYVEQTHSITFPLLPGDRILQFLEESDSIGLAAALRLLRAWVKERL
jgi:Uma2 family endonuclease